MRLPPVEEILPHLERVRRSGNGWVASCPVIGAHQNGDQSTSFSIADGDEQTVVHCFGGCGYNDVALAIFGLLGHPARGRDRGDDGRDQVAREQAIAAGLEPDPGLEESGLASDVGAGEPPAPAARPAAGGAGEPPGGRDGGPRKVVASYVYRAVDGRPLYRRIKCDPKSFWTEYPDGSGGWSSVRPADPPAATLYRLPELLAANPDRPVWVVEGEKDAERLASLGLVATTSGPATSWKKEFGSFFEGRKVCIIPDNDPVGRKYGQAIASSLVGRAISRRTLRLPVPSSGDVSDYLDAGHSIQDLFALAQGTREYPPKRWTPSALAVAQLPPLEGFVNGSIFCRATVSMIAGRRGVGKTFVVMKLANAISTGTHWGPYPTRKGSVLVLSQEMTDVEIRDRLSGMFSPGELAEMSNVTIICREDVRIDTDEAVERLAGIVESVGPDVVIIDTLSHVKGAIPENDNDELGAGVRRLIDQVATPYNCAVILTHHAGRAKADGTTNPRGASALEDMVADIMFLDHPKDAAFKVGTFAEPNGKVRHAAVPERMVYTIGFEDGRIEVDLMRDNGMIADRDTLIARVVGLIERKGSLPVNDIAEQVGISRALARDAVQGAKTIGLIERIGTGVDARWTLRVTSPLEGERYD